MVAEPKGLFRGRGRLIVAWHVLISEERSLRVIYRPVFTALSLISTHWMDFSFKCPLNYQSSIVTVYEWHRPATHLDGCIHCLRCFQDVHLVLENRNQGPSEPLEPAVAESTVRFFFVCLFFSCPVVTATFSHRAVSLYQKQSACHMLVFRINNLFKMRQ